MRPARPKAAGPPIRIGYARTSTVRQELASQLAALESASCTRVFSEKISSRIKTRPEFDKALALAREIRQAAPGQPVILAVHEMKRLARNAAELMTLSARLQADGIQLELLTGPLTGIYDPAGMGSMLFAALAVAAQLDRDYIREKTLEGQQVLSVVDLAHGGVVVGEAGLGMRWPRPIRFGRGWGGRGVAVVVRVSRVGGRGCCR